MAAIPDELPDVLLNKLTLTSEQCQAVFPNNAHAAERTAKWYSDRQGVTREMVDDAVQEANARIVIENGTLFIDNYKFGYQSRVMAIVHSLQSAVASAVDPLPNVEFTFGAGDFTAEKLVNWELSYKEGADPSTWLLVDFGFYSWPEAKIGAYSRFRGRAEAMIKQIPWKKKLNDLFWRGTVLSENRKQLMEIASHNSWGNVSEIDWWNEGKTTIVSPSDACQHKFLAGTEGNSYSGRLKYLLNCRSVIVSHRREYIQHFHHFLNYDNNSPDQNIVYTPGPLWDGLEDTMEELFDSDARAEKIAANAHKVFARRYLSPAALACYWRSAIRAYASVQKFKPNIGNAKAYEDFVLTERVYE